MILRKISLLMFAILLLGQNIQARKIALIVSISKYRSIIWPYINSANDIPLIKQALIYKGFNEEDIIILRDSMATKAEMVKAFQVYLIDQAQEGDIVFFHFSGHGQQVMDKNGDESDGYDEALVAYDASPYYSPGKYEGQNHFTDDELEVVLNKIRRKIGKKGNLLLTIDACFSGTISRGNKVCRSNQNKLAPDDYNPEVKFSTSNNESSGLYSEDQQNEMAPLIVFSAARQNEPNYETLDCNDIPVGSLSYAFSRALVKTNQNTTYEGLFDLIKLDMASYVPLQTPLAEGNLKTLTFAGQSVETSSHFKITEFKSDSICVLDVGGLAGVLEGAEISFFPIDTKDTKKVEAITKGLVIKANDFYSEVKFFPDKKEFIKSSWAYLTRESFGNMKINVFLDFKKANELNPLMADIPLINLVRDSVIADIIVRKLGRKDTSIIHFTIKNDNDQEVGLFKEYSTEDLTSLIKKQVVSYSKIKYIKRIETKSDDYHVKLELVPVDYKIENSRAIITKMNNPDTKLNNCGQIVFKEKDVFFFRIINLSSNDAYFQVIDIQPDNTVSVIIPDTYSTATDYMIEAYDTLNLSSSLMQISKPYGKDIIKIIASEKPIDKLKEIVSNKRAAEMGQTRSTLSPFELLLSNTLWGNRTRAASTSIGKNEINVSSVVINIVP